MKSSFFRSFLIACSLIIFLSNRVFAQSGSDSSTDMNCSLEQAITLVELNLCGKTSPGQLPSQRLSECERVSGLSTEITASLPLNRRLADLLQEAPPTEDLMSFVLSASSKDSDFLKKKTILRHWYSTLYQMVTAIELAVYTKADLGKSLLKRVERLEKDVLNLDDPMPESSLAERVLILMTTISPHEEQAEVAVEITGRKWDWLAGTPQALSTSKPVPPSADPRMPSKASKFLSDTGSTTKAVLTSPTFWKVVGVGVGLGALVGCYFLSRGSFNNYTPYERSCTGRSDCRVCDTCSSCPHCKNPTFIPPCGVYLRTRSIP